MDYIWPLIAGTTVLFLLVKAFQLGDRIGQIGWCPWRLDFSFSRLWNQIKHTRADRRGS